VLKVSTIGVPDVSDVERTRLLGGLRALRAGRKTEALGFARQAAFRELLVRCAGFMTPQEYEAAAEALDGALPPAVLRRVLSLELALFPDAASRPAGPADSGSWTAEALRAGPVAELTLEGIAPFDPRQCLYRNGQWVSAEITSDRSTR
jgi:hypothetical protein